MVSDILGNEISHDKITIFLSDTVRKQKDFVKLWELAIADGEILKVWLKDVNFPVHLTKKNFTNETGTKGYLYLITNDLEIDSNQFYQDYQKR